MPTFSTALSGLNAFATAIDVVGNNLANLNTPGFKQSTVSFHDLISQSFGESQVGFGVGRPVTLRQFSQGSLQTTAGALDAAIQGDGFFVVRAPSGNIQYTRAGNLQVDSKGVLTTVTGETVQGWTGINGVIDPNAPIANIVVPVGTLKAPKASTSASVDVNLDAGATAGPPATSFSTSLQVFDSLGNAHAVTFNFTRSATPNQWDYSFSFPDSDVTSPSTPATGSLTFDGNGHLISPTSADPPPTLVVTGLSSGASDMSIGWNLFDGTTPRLTQFAQASAVSALTQDGSATAGLTHISMEDGGKIVAQYSDGTQSVVGQIAMAAIRNPESLLAVGNNNFQSTTRTALAAIGLPGTGGRGSVVGAAIEGSTVDIAREFTNLIVFQRGYQANARVITTADQISQETINLKQ